jgi:hypothetical protein
MHVGFHIIEKSKMRMQMRIDVRMRIASNLFVQMECECEFKFALPALIHKKVTFFAVNDSFNRPRRYKEVAKGEGSVHRAYWHLCQ